MIDAEQCKDRKSLQDKCNIKPYVRTQYKDKCKAAQILLLLNKLNMYNKHPTPILYIYAQLCIYNNSRKSQRCRGKPITATPAERKTKFSYCLSHYVYFKVG